MKTLSERMLEAADTLEKVSKLYDYLRPEHSQWTAHMLRREATHVASEESDSVDWDAVHDGIATDDDWQAWAAQ